MQYERLYHQFTMNLLSISGFIEIRLNYGRLSNVTNSQAHYL
nr:MAG TPA: hypothetical protein [Caudoviricetes sp.]